MPVQRPPQRSASDSWFRISAAVLIVILIVTLPLYASGPLRIIFVLFYVTLLVLVRLGLIGPRS